MIKVHAFYIQGGSSYSPVTFVFQHQDGSTFYTFNSDCWEGGRPVLRKVKTFLYDIMGAHLPGRRNESNSVSVLNIVMDNGEEFEVCVDEHHEYAAYGDYYLGVADDRSTIRACAFGKHYRSSLDWATRHHNWIEPRGYDVHDVHISLEDFGVNVGRESGSNTTYPEEFGWVLDYRTGELIEDVGTANQLTTPS